MNRLPLATKQEVLLPRDGNALESDRMPHENEITEILGRSKGKQRVVLSEEEPIFPSTPSYTFANHRIFLDCIARLEGNMTVDFSSPKVVREVLLMYVIENEHMSDLRKRKAIGEIYELSTEKLRSTGMEILDIIARNLPKQ